MQKFMTIQSYIVCSDRKDAISFPDGKIGGTEEHFSTVHMRFERCHFNVGVSQLTGHISPSS